MRGRWEIPELCLDVLVGKSCDPHGMLTCWEYNMRIYIYLYKYIYIYMILVAMILEYMLVIGAPSLEDAGGIAIPSYIPELGV